MRVYASGAIDGALKGLLADYRAQLLAMIDKTADVDLLCGDPARITRLCAS